MRWLDHLGLVMDDQQYALMEAELHAVEEPYFVARPTHDNIKSRRIFRDAFERAWKARLKLESEERWKDLIAK